MTALTSLLVLATLFTQVSASLPKTSYFKMVDIWLLFCIIIIFFIIIFHTIIDLQVDYEEKKLTVTEAWSNPPSSTGARQVKVKPSGNDALFSTNERSIIKIPTLKMKLQIKLDLNFYIMTSKVTISTIFVVFNLVYWGTLAVDSGLVYFVSSE